MTAKPLSTVPDGVVSRVLIVDDDPQVLRLFEHILSKRGYAVTATSSGASALKILEARSFDLLVMDLSMPKPDGFDLLKLLRSTRPSLTILAVSGSIQNDLLPAAEMLGATATLPKSQAHRLLAETVAGLLGLNPSKSS